MVALFVESALFGTERLEGAAERDGERFVFFQRRQVCHRRSVQAVDSPGSTQESQLLCSHVKKLVQGWERVREGGRGRERGEWRG